MREHNPGRIGQVDHTEEYVRIQIKLELQVVF